MLVHLDSHFLTRSPVAMALVTSQVACTAPSTSSSGFISSVPNLVLKFPVNRMLRQMLRLGLCDEWDFGIVIRLGQHHNFTFPRRGRRSCPCWTSEEIRREPPSAESWGRSASWTCSGIGRCKSRGVGVTRPAHRSGSGSKVNFGYQRKFQLDMNFWGKSYQKMHNLKISTGGPNF